MSLAISTALGAVLLLIGWSDLRHRRIPNALVGAIVALWLLGLPGSAHGALAATLALALLVLLAGMLVWWFGWLGGGDVKLIAALSLWAGPTHLAAFLLATALLGGVLGLAMLLTPWFARSAALAPIVAALHVRLPDAIMTGSMSPTAPSLPYGLAIAAAGLLVVRPTVGI